MCASHVCDYQQEPFLVHQDFLLEYMKGQPRVYGLRESAYHRFIIWNVIGKHLSIQVSLNSFSILNIHIEYIEERQGK
jgi:hypothetical protein